MKRNGFEAGEASEFVQSLTSEQKLELGERVLTEAAMEFLDYAAEDEDFARSAIRHHREPANTPGHQTDGADAMQKISAALLTRSR